VTLAWAGAALIPTPATSANAAAEPISAVLLRIDPPVYDEAPVRPTPSGRSLAYRTP